MRQHSERIRRIQALCAELDLTIQDSHAVQQTVEQLKAESGRLLDDLRPGDKTSNHARAKPSSHRRRRDKRDS
jgi:hypothetical protein